MSRTSTKYLPIVAFGLFVVAATASGGLLGELGWGILGMEADDRSRMLAGSAVGAVLGLLGATLAHRRPVVHRALVVGGVFLVLVGVVVAVLGPRGGGGGDGEMYAGLGRALWMLLGAWVAGIGVLWLLAGWVGLRAHRSAP